MNARDFAFCFPFLPLFILGCNEPPSAVVLELAPDVPTTTEDLTLTIPPPSDPDGDPVTTTITWFLGADPQSDYADTTTLPAAATAKHQVWKAYVVPSDGSLEGPASSVEVTILNTPPEVELSLSPHEPLTTEDVTPTVVTSDADEDEVTVTYQWLLNDEPSAYTDPTLPAAATERGQVWTLEVNPDDGDENGEVASATVNIENTAPVIDIVVLSPEEPTETDTITAAVEASDDDGDDITLTYAWYVDGELVLEGSASEITGEHFDKHQEVHVEVVGNDGFIDGDVLASDAVTVLNSAPSITGVLLDPDEIYEETEVACSPQGWSDADGDEPRYSYVWEVDGYVVSTADTLTGALFDEDQTVKCTATPSDGEATGTAFTSAVATVLNTPPVLASVTLSTTSPVEGDTITTTLGALTDVDGDATTVRYTWFVDGIQVSTGASIDSSLFDKHQAIHVEVTPNDGDEDGDVVSSATATALNTGPEITVLTLSPSDLYTDDVLSTSVTTTDADGDTVTLSYAWTVDGTSISETGATLDGASWFDKHQTVGVVVTPNDGEDDGGADSASIDVLNSAPTAPVLVIDPEEPEAGVDDLVCSMTTEPTDPDGDAWSASYSWAVDGVTFTEVGTSVAPGDTVEGTSTGDDELWRCSVVAEDSDGGTVSSSVEVTTEYFADPWVAIGHAHACSLDRFGEVYCWGDDDYWGAVSGAPEEPLRSVTCTPGSSFGLDADGSLVAWGMWGGYVTLVGSGYELVVCSDSDEIQCAALDADGYVTMFGHAWSTLPSAPSDSFSMLETSPCCDEMFCGIDSGGTIQCWGNGEAELFDDIPSGTFVDVDISRYCACAIDTSGNLQCWGRAGFPGNTDCLNPPVGSYVDVALGFTGACAVATDGTIDCWGIDERGSLSPPSGSGYQRVFMGYYYGCALYDEDSYECWGGLGELE